MFRSISSWWQDRLLRTVLQNSGYLLSSNSAAIFLSMAQSVFAARLLGVQGFGLLSATIIPFVSTVNRLFSFRMSELVVKYMGDSLAEGDHQRAAAVVKGAGLADLIASLLGYSLLILLTPLAASYIAKDAASAPLFLLYGVVLFTTATFETATGILQVADRFRTIAAVNLIQSVITAALIFAAYLTEGGLLEVLLAYLLGKTFAGAAITAIAFFELSKRIGRAWWRTPLRFLPDWKGMARFAFSTNLSSTVNLVARDSEALFVAALRTPVEAGYYKIALAVINLVMLPIQPLIGTTYTEISRSIARRYWAEAAGLLKKVSLVAGAWTLAASGFLAVFGGWAIGRLYGPDFEPAYPALLILLVGFGFANVLFWNRPLLLALGMPAYPLKVAALFGLVKTGLALWLVPAFGYLVQAGLLSAFFVLTIGLNVRRGIQEVQLRYREARLSQAGAS